MNLRRSDKNLKRLYLILASNGGLLIIRLNRTSSSIRRTELIVPVTSHLWLISMVVGGSKLLSMSVPSSSYSFFPYSHIRLVPWSPA